MSDTPIVDKSKMRVGSNNNYRIADLFWETSRRKEYALYTLKDEGHSNLINIREAYLDIADITEYEFAKTYFLSYKHWLTVAESATLSPYIEEWRQELRVKIRSAGVKGMISASREGNTTASKWLAESGWESTPTRKKKKVKTSSLEDKRIQEDINEDLNRMRDIQH